MRIFPICRDLNVTLRMGYTRIEDLAGGAAFLSAKIGGCQRNGGREGRTSPHVESGQRRTNPPMSELTTRKCAKKAQIFAYMQFLL